MIDNESSSRPVDRIQINVKDERELNSWAMEFDISRQLLKDVVLRVGPTVQHVTSALHRRRQSQGLN